MTNLWQRYLEKKTIKGPWEIAGTTRNDFTTAIVIPACDEEESLFTMLSSLAANPPEARQNVLVLVVINHPSDADRTVKSANLRTLDKLSGSALQAELGLGWIDACSGGRELPKGGVGSARKLGFDLALTRLRQGHESILAALDADTLVEPNYMETLARHFIASPAGGAVVPFAHQPAPDPERQRAIDHYELYLRCYVLGLRIAGSPYAFHTIGSSMACRASAYVRCGGMNRKKAGEDFYFLQSLAKTDGIEQLTGTTVHPSARLSTRVPFGTGPSVRHLLQNPEERMFYPTAAFDRLGAFLRLVAASADLTGEGLLAVTSEMDEVLGRFLEQQGMASTWDRLCRNHRTRGKRLAAFHHWFDGLKTLQLLKHFSWSDRSGFLSPAAAASSLFSRIGLTPSGSISGDLAALRRWQNFPELADKENNLRYK